MRLVNETPEMIKRLLDTGQYSEELFVDLWDRWAFIQPDEVAFADSDTRMTFGQVKEYSDRVAVGLHKLGITRDDALVSQIPNSAKGFAFWLSREKIGLPVASCMATLRHKEMLHVLKATRAAGVVIKPLYRNFNFYEMVQELKPELPSLRYIFILGDEVPPGTISLDAMAETPLSPEYGRDFFRAHRMKPGEASHLAVTSGTTGLPKVAAHDMSWMVIDCFEKARKWRLTTEDVFGCFAPHFGGGGSFAWAAASVGARIVFMERFEPEQAMRLIEHERITFAATVPAQIVMMAKHPNLGQYDLSSLRIMGYAGAACPSSVIEEVEHKLGCRVIAQYGTSEAGFITTHTMDDPLEIRAHSVGKGMTTSEAKIADENGAPAAAGEIGEAWVRGGQLGSGYLTEDGTGPPPWGDDPEGWVRTGDLVRRDEQGYLYVVGRAKDMIIRGGQNIYPKEIEELLAKHPKVLNVAVVPMPDMVMGEKACACVITRQEQAPLTFEEMVDYLKREKIAPFKLPERLEIVTEFPMAGDGLKVAKRELTKDITGKLLVEASSAGA